jgi:hypothetical protein
MDTRFFGNNLLALNEVRDLRRRLSQGAAENAYYKQHTPAPDDGRVLKIASVVAAVWFGFMAFGLWLQ